MKQMDDGNIFGMWDSLLHIFTSNKNKEFQAESSEGGVVGGEMNKENGLELAEEIFRKRERV